MNEATKLRRSPVGEAEVARAGLPNPFSDENVQAGPTDDERRRIVQLSRALVIKQREEKRKEDELAEIKAERIRLEEVDLPEAMIAAGIRMEQLSDGAKVELKTDYQCGELRGEDSFVRGKLRPGNPDGIAYIEREAADLIDHDVNMRFGRGQERMVKMALGLIRRWKTVENFKLSEKRAVNFMRLKGWVGAKAEAGVDLPLELLGVHVRRYAKVTIEEPKSGGI